MIGGTDISLDTFDQKPEKVLSSVTHVARKHWPSCVTVDALTGERFDSASGEAAFSEISELLVFHDEESRARWDELGADPANENTVLYAIARARVLTLVVEDASTDFARSVVAELSALFGRGTP